MDEPPSVTLEEKEQEEEEEDEEEEETKVVDEQEEEEEEEETKVVDEQEENLIPTNRDKQEESDINIEDSIDHRPIINQNDTITSFTRSRSPSLRNEEQSSIPIDRDLFQSIPGQASVAPSLASSTTLLTPIEPPIRVEINEKTKPFISLSQNVPQVRKEPIPIIPPPPPASSQPSRLRKQPSELYHRASIKTNVSDQLTGKRYCVFLYIFLLFFFSSLLLPNNSSMWDSYGKQNGI